LWDEVHVLIVNYNRQEMYLYENAGGGEQGVFHIRSADAATRASITDPFSILNMAMRFAVNFDLLARVLDAEMVRVLEAIGAKTFLTQLVSNTTEALRRKRFDGLNFFEFTINPNSNGAAAQFEPEDDDFEEDEEYEPEEPIGEVKAPEGATRLASAVKAPRSRRSSK
jgi:hypothetical protein